MFRSAETMMIGRDGRFWLSLVSDLCIVSVTVPHKSRSTCSRSFVVLIDMRWFAIDSTKKFSWSPSSTFLAAILERLLLPIFADEQEVMVRSL